MSLQFREKYIFSKAPVDLDNEVVVENFRSFALAFSEDGLSLYTHHNIYDKFDIIKILIINLRKSFTRFSVFRIISKPTN